MEITHKWTNGNSGIPMDAKEIRTIVFMEEQGFKIEFDDLDTVCQHLVVYSNDKAVGTARIFPDDSGKIYHIGRVAVIKESRGTGLGSIVMQLAEKKISELGGTEITLSAQVSAEKFYKSLGFSPKGEPYLDEYCPHICMIKTIR